MVLTPWSQDSHGLRLKQPAYLHVFSFCGYVAISAKYNLSLPQEFRESRSIQTSKAKYC